MVGPQYFFHDFGNDFPAMTFLQWPLYWRHFTSVLVSPKSRIAFASWSYVFAFILRVYSLISCQKFSIELISGNSGGIGYQQMLLPSNQCLTLTSRCGKLVCTVAQIFNKTSDSYFPVKRFWFNSIEVFDLYLPIMISLIFQCLKFDFKK